MLQPHAAIDNTLEETRQNGIKQSLEWFLLQQFTNEH
jgi:hypothetical protein